jgi:hypothetical protein
LISRYHRRISVGVLCFDHGRYPLVTPIRYPLYDPYPLYPLEESIDYTDKLLIP